MKGLRVKLETYWDELGWHWFFYIAGNLRVTPGRSYTTNAAAKRSAKLWAKRLGIDIKETNDG